MPKWSRFAAGGLLIGVLLLAGFIQHLGSSDSSSKQDSANPPSTSATTSTSVAPTSASAAVNGVSFASRGLHRDTECATHAFGDTRVWLGRHRCTALVRGLFEAPIGTRKAGVSVAVVTFPDPATAEAFQRLSDAPGSGGITDLADEGRGWPGGPDSFDNSGYASTRNDTVVRVVQAVWADGRTLPEDPALRTLATQALHIPIPG